MVFASCGNSANWSKTTYEFRDRSVRAHTSLKILQEVIKPEKTVILGLDTLATEGLSYDEIRKNAEDKIIRYADDFGIMNYKVIVAPGIGAFPSGIFYGNALDYYYYVLAEASSVMLQCPDNKLDIHLDLTHGINYSTILTYRAIKELLEVFSIFYDVKFKAYNSDPSSPKATERLRINIIEDVIPTSRPPSERIIRGVTLRFPGLSPEERRRLSESNLKYLRYVDKYEISAFIGALYNGLPLALFSFYPDPPLLKRIIQETIKVYEKCIRISKDKKLIVERNAEFLNDFKVYIFAYLIAALLKKQGLIDHRISEVNLDDLENITSKLFKFDERLRIIIENEIFNMKEKIENLKISGWQLYNQVLGKHIGDPDSRNFIAHAGIEGNITEIKEDNGKIFLRYRKERIRTIKKKLCLRGLK